MVYFIISESVFEEEDDEVAPTRNHLNTLSSS